LIKHRARADVVLADAATIAALARDTLIRPESVVSLGRDPYVLVVNSGTAAVMAQSAAGILATHEVVVPDPTTAASFDGAAVLQAAFPSGVALRLIGVAETGAVVAAVSRDRAVAGLVYRSEAGAPGISMVAALPLPAIAMSGALVINGQSAQAPALLAFINTPAGAAILRDGGLERGL
jgi:ABC-type molybdate transport system substrate-binding protein